MKAQAPDIPPFPPTLAEDSSLPFVELNGYRFHCNVSGHEHKETLLVLHGGPGGDSRYLLPLEELKHSYRIVFYDQRGCGLSPRTADAELQLNQYLQDLDAFVNYLLQKEGSTVSILGHSWGGFLAIQYVCRHGNKIHKLVLAEPYIPSLRTNARLFLNNIQFKVLKKLWRALGRSFMLPSTDPDVRKDYFFEQVLRHSNPAYHCSYKQPTLKAWRPGYRAYLGLSFSRKSKSEQKKVDQIHFPARQMLLLVSKCNQLLGISYQQKLRKRLGYPTLVQVPESGHYLFSDNKEATLQAVDSFLKQRA